MTIQQLRYAVMVAEKGTISEAAKALYISQPSLTNALKELEKEIGIAIFQRTNKGVMLQPEGNEFLGYARQVLEQTALLEERYLGVTNQKPRFCVSTQHYSFAVNAFVDVIRAFGGNQYDFTLRETKTHEIIEDVSCRMSEIGVLYFSSKNEEVLHKIIRQEELVVEELFVAKPHVIHSFCYFQPLFPYELCPL